MHVHTNCGEFMSHTALTDMGISHPISASLAIAKHNKYDKGSNIVLSLVGASLWEPSLSFLSGCMISFNRYCAREFFLCHSRELALGSGCFLPLCGSSLRCGLDCFGVLFFLSRRTISFNCYRAREIFSAILASSASGRLFLLDVSGFETVHQEPCLNLRKPNL